MATSTISHTVTDGSGTAVGSGHEVEALLMPGSAFRTSDSSGIARRVTTSTDAQGAFSIALERQANIVSPSDTWWQITIDLPASKGGPQLYAISVGASNTTLLASLVTPSSSSALSAYITQTAGDARYALKSSALTGNFASVMDASYGALNTNTGDDSTAINAAITAVSAAGGGVVFFPKGSGYRCTSAINLASNVVLLGEGYGSYINFVALASGIIGTSKDRIGVVNLRLGGTTTRCVRLTTCTNVRIVDNFISGATIDDATNYSAGVWINECTDVWIERNSFSANGIGASSNRSGDIITYTTANVRVRILNNSCLSTAAHFSIGAFNCSYSEVKGNYCTGAIEDASDNSGYGILLYDAGSAGTTHHNVVEGNTVYSTAGNGIYLQGSPYSTVVGNVCRETGLTQGDASLGVGGIVINACPHTTVANNMIRDSGKDGIVLTGTGSNQTVTGNTIYSCVQAGIWNRAASNYAVIANNSINDCGRGIYSSVATTGLAILNNTIAGSTGVLAGIDVTANLTDGSINGNTVVSAGGYGIDLAGGTRNRIQNNGVKNCGAGNAGTYDGIRFSSTETLVEGNHSSNAGTSNQNYGINDGSAGTDNLVIGNNVKGNVQSLGIDPGAATVMRDNLGYVTRATGATSVADGGTITHGLAAAPTKVIATSVTSGEFVSVTALGATTFTVAVKKHDNSAGTTAVVYWLAEV